MRMHLTVVCWVGGFSLEHTKQIARVLGFTSAHQRQTHAETQRVKLDLWVAELGRCSTLKRQAGRPETDISRARTLTPEVRECCCVRLSLWEYVSFYPALCARVFDVAVQRLHKDQLLPWIPPFSVGSAWKCTSILIKRNIWLNIENTNNTL